MHCQVITLLLIVGVAGCTQPSVTSIPFGVHNGTHVRLYTVTNANNNSMIKVTNYGCIITTVLAKDRNGESGDVVLGFDTLKEYEKHPGFYGSQIGRFANRIAKGTFTLNNKTYHLPINDPPNSLHGGFIGFNQRVWTVANVITNNDHAGVEFTYFSPDGEEGYPGNLNVSITILLNNNNELTMKYAATTDQDTIINFTHHGYFNLGAGKVPNILDHKLTINAKKYTPVDSTLIPTGELKDVQGTPFDFMSARTVGSRIKQLSGGYDHNFVLDDAPTLKEVANLVETTTGRVMIVLTDQPGIQFYSGNFLNGNVIGKYGIKYVKHYALTLETQHYPDSPNQPSFPTTVLKAHDHFKSTTVYRFTTDK